ncbi:MAG TPA: UDP-N-acetylmuramoyl-L-alanyl-D-glutamate--2,6-diaminopimelate ligase [Candidatus Limnocylindrales bacterium]|nr:UDP-N-acetylmuramoyl-L-alanyl-D-glutamate--2,6-diaminopimelate ligase [Candidatus Limnocylindrales bacterium]
MSELDRAPAPGGLAELVARLDREGRLVSLSGGASGDAATIAGLAGIGLAAITDDSRHVSPGALFVAVRGSRADGHEFVTEAVQRGAAAVIVERPGLVGAGRAGERNGMSEGPVEIVVDRSAAALASAAAWWFGDPSRSLTVVGTTGTNGKTTTTFLVAAGLAGVGHRVGLSTTVGSTVGGRFEPNTRPVTTPGALELQALLRRMVLAGDDAVALETSSHGLAAERVGSVAYDAAIFTTLGQEHLDFHRTMAAYLAAKRSLFERLPVTAKDGRAGLGVVNVDDPAAGAFADAARRAGARVVTYGTDPRADVRLLEVSATVSSVEALVAIAGGGTRRLRLRLGGRYNARNAAAVVALAHGWGLPVGAVVDGLAELRGIPGRLEPVDRGQPFAVVVDFAHTSGSIEALLVEARAGIAPGARVAIVFGASGERDEGKRPLMGEAAVRGADRTFITEDDPRAEDLTAILAAIEAGAQRAGGRPGETYELVPSREAAIRAAVRWARPGDVVVLAGKGHETWMARAGGLEAWDDRDVAARILGEEGYGSRAR